ncbi:DUF2169 family type VI secretion system accessory protein [Serratia microhaemolytica]|uniref:DUF2169 family type VI secretion system accessory protein n=1 Tax=Serratia microhaemolytica TaxID=2675110 RepID=UPI000FDD5137|nr:DUF2169 domain-containing protein [Serratia microhaemolytica]
MEVVNGAKHTVAEAIMMMDKEGNEFVVVIIKATYRIPKDGKMPRPIIPPQPIVQADQFTGEPGLSAVIYEADYVLRKPLCDVLFHARAHTPDNYPKQSVTVTVQVASMTKTLKVYGPGTWQSGPTGLVAQRQPFVTSLPLTYDHALGGAHAWDDNDPTRIETHRINPVGVGYATKAKRKLADTPTPCIEALDRPITAPDSKAVPQALSALPRNSALRVCYAGTYDETWRQEVFPFLPEDFDERYCQSSPADQQIPYPQGGESVYLANLMAGRTEVRFNLPRFDNIPIRVLKHNHDVLEVQPIVDTLFFEPDEQRFSVVWRGVIPLVRKIREIETIAIGPVCKEWWANKLTGSGCGSCNGNRDQDEAEAGVAA